MSKAAKNMEHQTGLMQRQAKQIQKAGKSIQSVGSSLTRKVTIPIIGVGVASGKMADTFQRNMGQINTLLDNTSHLQGYKDAVLRTSNDTGLGLDTTAKGMYQAISSLGDGGKKTEKIFDTMAKSAKAGGAEVKDSVSLISSGMKGYNSISETTAKKISDLAFQTQKLGVTTFPEMAESMQPLFPLGNSLNVSYEELFGSMATLTGVTGNTAEVTTQMKGIFTGLLKPTESMQNLMAKYGYQNGQAMIKAKGMSGVLQILKKETGGQSDKMAKLFGNSRALVGALALTGSQYDTFNQKTKKMKDSTGSTEKALKAIQTPLSKIRKSVNIAKNGMTVFGEAVLKVVVPPATKLANKVKDLSERFSKLNPKTQETIVKVAMVAAAVGPVILMFGKMVFWVGKSYLAWARLLKSINRFGGIAAMIKSPAGIVIIALLAIVTAAVLVYKNWDKISAGAKKMAKFVISAMKSAGIDVKQLGKTVKAIASNINSAFKTIIKILKSLLKALAPIAKFIGGTLLKIVKLAMKLMIGYFSGWLKSTLDIIKGVTKAFSGIVDFISGVFTGNWKKAWQGVKKIFSGIFEALLGIAKRPLNGIIGLVNTVIGGLNKLKIKIPSWVPGKYGGKSFGVNIPKIPALAKGTQNWKGGIAQINEKGGEIVDLPKGAKVWPHDKSIQKAKEEGKKSIVIQKLADQIIIREDKDIDRIVDAIVKKLLKVVV